MANVVADRVRPVALAREQTLPVPAALAALFPDGRLRRGITAAVRGPGATSIACALAGAATEAGSWLAIVGDRAREVGLLAAAEQGIALERVGVLPAGAGQLSPTVAALLGAFDVVVVNATARVSAGEARRLMARARERGTVIIALSTPWPEAVDLELTLHAPRWHGIGQGHGHLQQRELVIRSSGRRELSRPRQLTLTLPAGGEPLLAAGVVTAPAGTFDAVVERASNA